MTPRLAGTRGPSLGAVELIELGRPHRQKQPMLRNRPKLGDIFSTAGKFMADALSTVFGVLADIIKVPSDLLVQGVDVVFENVATALQELPWIGDLAAQVLLAAGAVLKFAISVPFLALDGIRNIFEGISKALDATGSPEEKKEKIDAAKERIIEQAPTAIKADVEEMLDEAPTGGTGETPVKETDILTDVLTVGIPAVLAVGAIAIVAS